MGGPLVSGSLTSWRALFPGLVGTLWGPTGTFWGPTGTPEHPVCVPPPSRLSPPTAPGWEQGCPRWFGVFLSPPPGAQFLLVMVDGSCP